ncbi:MAG: hypothetical protein [Caudoviricetes sp.]|nr:MAG: hypothetical protein [Caudoviricetes sp.]
MDKDKLVTEAGLHWKINELSRELIEASAKLVEQQADVERLRAALREHACECVSVCMDARHKYGEIDTPDTCKYGRAAAALAEKNPNE